MCEKCFADGSAYNGPEPVGSKVIRKTTCGRCSGHGSVHWGVCFACNGRGFFAKEAVIHDAAKLAASKARKAEREAAKAQAIKDEHHHQKLAVLKAIEGGSVALMKAQIMLSSGERLGVPSLKSKLLNLRELVEGRGAWTEKRAQYLISLVDQINALEGKIRDQRHDDEETRKDPSKWIKPGRLVIEGVVLTAKVKESEFGDVLKMLVQDDEGRKYWSTVPRGMALNEGERGARVRFTATVKRSPDDPIFAFCSRPAGGEVLSQPAAA